LNPEFNSHYILFRSIIFKSVFAIRLELSRHSIMVLHVRQFPYLIVVLFVSSKHKNALKVITSLYFIIQNLSFTIARTVDDILTSAFN
jgi:hypothetical protein